MPLNRLDRSLFRLLHYRAGELPLLDPMLLHCARFGSFGEVLLMLAAGSASGRRGPAVVGRCLAAVAAIYPLTEVIGRLAGRERPFAADSDARALLEHGPSRSFPSRHVASGVAMGLLVRQHQKRLGGAMLLLAAAMGLGRVRAGLHYPSDVAAGIGLGAAVGLSPRWAGSRPPRAPF